MQTVLDARSWLAAALLGACAIAAGAQEARTVRIGGTTVSVTRQSDTWNASFPPGIPPVVPGDTTTLSRRQAVLVGGIERAAGCIAVDPKIDEAGLLVRARVDCGPGARQPDHLARAVLFTPANLEKLAACDDYKHVAQYEFLDAYSDEWLGPLLSRERPLLNYEPGTPQFRLVQTPSVLGMKTAGISSNFGMSPGGVLLFELPFETVERALRAKGVDLACEPLQGLRACARRPDVAISPELLRGQQGGTLTLALVESRQLQRTGVALACIPMWPGRMR